MKGKAEFNQQSFGGIFLRKFFKSTLKSVYCPGSGSAFIKFCWSGSAYYHIAQNILSILYRLKLNVITIIYHLNENPPLEIFQHRCLLVFIFLNTGFMKMKKIMKVFIYIYVSFMMRYLVTKIHRRRGIGNSILHSMLGKLQKKVLFLVDQPLKGGGLKSRATKKKRNFLELENKKIK